MRWLLYWLLGNTVIEIESCDLKNLLNVANKTGIRILNIKISEEKATFQVFVYNEKKIVAALINAKIKYKFLKKSGVLEFLKKYVHRVGIVIGICIMALAVCFSSKFIWQINISGLERLNEEYICKLLKNEGVYIGAYSPLINRKKLYSSIIRNDDNISWITVNFIGGIANVEISERDYTEAAEMKADAANIIAKKDGQIVGTEIQNGKCIVNKGDVVKKGEVLVSGIYDTANGGTRYVYADADIFALVSEEFVIEVPLENCKKVYNKEVVKSRGIKLFEKKIIFYKNYSNLEANCDTIGKEDKLDFLGFENIPISLISELEMYYDNVPVFFTEEEALKHAQREFYKELDSNTEYVDMISVEEEYSINDSILTYRATVEAIENIASTAEIQIN